MGGGGFKIRDQAGIHFITFSVVGWISVFERKFYCGLLLDSLRYCQKHKGLVLYSWCIMPNHIHLIISAKHNNLSDVLRDFKKFTSKKMINSIVNNDQDNRRNCMIEMFKSAGASNIRNRIYQFWQQDNHPEVLFGNYFTKQKLAYIHNNPKKAGIVNKPEEYPYSSAIDYFYGKKCGLLEIEFL